jgi:CBS domain-containing protein
VIGVVSEGDLLCQAEKTSSDEELSPFLETGRQRAAHSRATAVVARGLMSTPAVTIAAKAPAAKAAQVLAHGRFRQLPVVDGEGRLVGMITRGDLIQKFVPAGYAAAGNPPGRSVRRS